LTVIAQYIQFIDFKLLIDETRMIDHKLKQV